jgi:L-ascorbate metabolism protein UlaG (beta-lactamase superfamily)
MRLKLGRPDLTRYADLFDAPAGDGDVMVTFLGVSTLLFDDGDSAVLFDGFFSRPSLVRVVLRRIAPDIDRIDAILTRLGFGPGGRTLDAVSPVHTHFDHALDSATVVARAGGVLVGGDSTANIGRGCGLPEDRIHVVAPGTRAIYGSFTLTHLVSAHCPPDRFPGTITAPLVPPARAREYKCGEAWSILVEHTGAQTGGPTALVQGSAGFVPHALDGHRADVAYLGVGQLGVHPEPYIRDFWHHTVRAVGARRVVLTHWDDFFRPLDQPLRALPYASDDLDVTLRVLRAEAQKDGVRLTMPSVWRAERPWSTR